MRRRVRAFAAALCAARLCAVPLCAVLLCSLAACTHRDTRAGPRRAPVRQPSAAPTPTPPRVPVVVLDPGHNGENWAYPRQVDRPVPAGNGARKVCNTTGTATDAGYPEHAFDWDVALRVRQLLRPHVRVVLTRRDDRGVGPCVDERAAIGNRARADAVVSIHADGSLTGHGFHVIRAPHGQRSRALAVAVHNAMEAGTRLVPATYAGSHGYDVRTDLAGLNLSTRPAILVECGNMRDAGDAAIQSSPAGRERIARAIAAGVRGYLAHPLPPAR